MKPYQTMFLHAVDFATDGGTNETDARALIALCNEVTTAENPAVADLVQTTARLAEHTPGGIINLARQLSVLILTEYRPDKPQFTAAARAVQAGEADDGAQREFLIDVGIIAFRDGAADRNTQRVNDARYLFYLARLGSPLAVAEMAAVFAKDTIELVEELNA